MKDDATSHAKRQDEVPSIRDLRMRYPDLHLVHKESASRPALLLLGIAWVSGCASSGSVRSAWQTPAPHPAFSRILIVGVSTDINQRCDFEFAMSSQFSGASPQPIMSCNSMTSKDPLTRANIERVAAAAHADAVLTTALVSVQTSEQKGEPIAYYQVTGQGYVTGPLGEYGVPVAVVQLESTTPLPTITGDVHLVTKLFDTKDATLVYTLETQAKEDATQSTSATMGALTDQIGDRLHRDGVIH
jgi:hypothetical protein